MNERPPIDKFEPLTEAEIAAVPSIGGADQDEGECVMPVPADAPPIPETPGENGKPSQLWTYRDASGAGRSGKAPRTQTRSPPPPAGWRSAMIPMMREGRPPRPRGEPANMPTKRPGEEKQTNLATPPAQTQAQNRFRRQRLVERLERYGRLDPDFVRALGGDRYVPIFHVIDGGGR